MFSHCGLLENKAELSVVVKFKKILFYPVMLKPASSQSSDFARGWEEVAGEGKVGGRHGRSGRHQGTDIS